MRAETYVEQAQKKFAQSKHSRIVYFAPDTNLRCGHEGLKEIARKSKQKVFVEALHPGEYLIFTNKARTALKLYAAGNIIVHLKMPEGEKLNMNAIKYIPRFFNGEEINYKGALAEALREQIERLDRVKGKVYNA